MPLWSDASGFAPLGGFNVALCGAFLPSTSYDLLPYAEWDPVAGLSTVGYDLSGRRTTLVSPAGKFTYSYDAADELLVQYTPTGSVSYGYDPNGSRTYQKSTTTTTTYLWDPRNRLQQVILPAGSLCTQTYRPDDMRLSESTSTGISTMVWSNNDVLGMVGTQSGSPMQQVFALTPVSVPVSVSGHAGGGGIGLPLPHSPTPSLVRAMGRHADGSAINRAYHLDNQGGVLAITTATGSIEADYHTDSWGNVISGTAADNPYVYLGGLGYWQDSSLSLNYVRARWQEPSTGSWLSVDNVRREPRYAYAHNSPTRLVDPSGRQVEMGQPPSYSALEDAIGLVVGQENEARIHRALVRLGAAGMVVMGPLIAILKHYHELWDSQFKADSSWSKMPPIFYNLRPPYIEVVSIFGHPVGLFPSLEWPNYMTGILVGCLETAFWLSPFGDAAFILELIYEYCYSMINVPGGPIESLIEYITKSVLSIDELLFQRVDLDAYTRGYMTATIIGAVLMIILAVGAIISEIGDIALPLLAAGFTKSGEHIANALAKASESLRISQEQLKKLISDVRDVAQTNPKLVTPEGFKFDLNRFNADGGVPSHNARLKKHISQYKSGEGGGGDIGKGDGAPEPKGKPEPAGNPEPHGPRTGDQWFDPADLPLVAYLRGKDLEVYHNPLEGVKGAGRQGDAFVDGTLTEFKRPQPGANSTRIKNIVQKSVEERGPVELRGQARVIIINAQGTGLTRSEAQFGLNRALKPEITHGRIDRVRIVGDGYDIEGTAEGIVR